MTKWAPTDAALEALSDQPPTEDRTTLLDLWQRLLDAFEGTPPLSTFHVVSLLFLDDVPPDLEALRRAWSERTGIPLREPVGDPVR